MPAKRIKMRKLRDILRLRFSGGLSAYSGEREHLFRFNVNTYSGRT